MLKAIFDFFKIKKETKPVVVKEQAVLKDKVEVKVAKPKAKITAKKKKAV